MVDTGSPYGTLFAYLAHVGLSPRASLERVRRLEAAGIISGYRAVIDLARLSRPVNIFAEITLARQAQEFLAKQSYDYRTHFESVAKPLAAVVRSSIQAKSSGQIRCHRNRRW